MVFHSSNLNSRCAERLLAGWPSVDRRGRDATRSPTVSRQQIQPESDSTLLWTAISFIVKGRQIVDIPAVSKNQPSNPLLGYNGAHTAPPSTAKSSTLSDTQRTLANLVLLRDQRCLVTGAASIQLQACHLVNTIRVKKSNENTKAL